MEIHAYSQEKHESRAIAQAVSYVLSYQNKAYLGKQSSFRIKEIDSVFISPHPVRPNLFAYTIAGALVGVVISFLWVLWNTYMMGAVAFFAYPKKEPAEYFAHTL